MKVEIDSNELSSMVCQGRHTTQIVGLEDAECWLKFYEKLAAGKSGQHYTKAVAAFSEALEGMKRPRG
ncbi:MAG: hypothetical protein ABJL99_10060 [Aliishimia sp.]